MNTNGKKPEVLEEFGDAQVRVQKVKLGNYVKYQIVHLYRDPKTHERKTTGYLQGLADLREAYAVIGEYLAKLDAPETDAGTETAEIAE